MQMHRGKAARRSMTSDAIWSAAEKGRRSADPASPCFIALLLRGLSVLILGQSRGPTTGQFANTSSGSHVPSSLAIDHEPPQLPGEGRLHIAPRHVPTRPRAFLETLVDEEEMACSRLAGAFEIHLRRSCRTLDP